MKPILLRTKKKICIECSKESFIFSKGRCKYCSLNSYTYKKSTPITEGKLKTELNSFFDIALSTVKYCEETGARIVFPTRANICHLFNKRHHKSVESDLRNYIVLTIDEHKKLDELIFDRLAFHRLEKIFPNTWKIIIKRMRECREFIEEKSKFVEAFDKFSKECTYAD